jgi:hypothetical protein
MSESMIFDTQLLSAAFRLNGGLDIRDAVTSSVSLGELFGMYYTEPRSRRTYQDVKLFIPNFKSIMPEPLRGSWHPRVFKRSSGRIEFYFRDEYPTVFEYNSLGLAAAVNNACFDAISLAIEPLSRREKQRIRSIWSFLVDNRVSCKPLGASIASQAMNLVSFAGARYTFKPNFRNSLNDLIVFATALQHCLEVTTADKLLARIVAEYAGVSTVETDDVVRLSFAGAQRPEPGPKQAYKNRGWALACTLGIDRDEFRARKALVRRARHIATKRFT